MNKVILGKQKTIRFGDLEPGDCFFFQTEDPCMAVTTEERMVRLTDGAYLFIGKESIVTPIPEVTLIQGDKGPREPFIRWGDIRNNPELQESEDFKRAVLEGGWKTQKPEPLTTLSGAVVEKPPEPKKNGALVIAALWDSVPDEAKSGQSTNTCPDCQKPLFLTENERDAMSKGATAVCPQCIMVRTKGNIAPTMRRPVKGPK